MAREAQVASGRAERFGSSRWWGVGPPRPRRQQMSRFPQRATSRFDVHQAEPDKLGRMTAHFGPDLCLWALYWCLDRRDAASFVSPLLGVGWEDRRQQARKLGLDFSQAAGMLRIRALRRIERRAPKEVEWPRRTRTRTRTGS
jgi:hypothetical protein